MVFKVGGVVGDGHKPRIMSYSGIDLTNVSLNGLRSDATGVESVVLLLYV